jgi:site-specific recombinase XerD
MATTTPARAYGRAAGAFLHWCEKRGIHRLENVQPVHVAAYIEALQDTMAAPTVKQHLACIRMLFDWLVTGQRSCPRIPRTPCGGPRHSVSKGSTQVLSSEEASGLIEGMDVSTVVGLRDRAILAVMTLHLRPPVSGPVVDLKLETYLDAYL